MDKRKIIEKELSNFKKNLSAIININKVVFFGSFARGDFRRDSDIDLIIVSSDFRGIEFRKRALGFYKYWSLDYPFDFLCYTPEEFNRLKYKSNIVREAVKEGIEI